MKRREQTAHAARRQARRDSTTPQRRTPRRRGDSDHAPRPRPDLRFNWTPTGISLSLDGLTIDADYATNNPFGQRALVSVSWGGRLCYRQQLNLEDPHQRQTFIGKLRLSCEQAGLTSVVRFVDDRVTPRVLIELSEACRSRHAKSFTDPDPQTQDAERAVAEERAGSLLDDPAILSRVGEAMRANGYAGRLEPAQLAYVALTSRLLEGRPVNLGLVGDPAAGKNATIDAALALVPPEAVYQFTASSPTALVYSDEDFRHRVVIFKEADSIPDRGPAASAIRALADNNVLRYEVTIRGARTGGLETWKLEKAGPTGLITTSIRPVSPQLHTRLLPVPMGTSDDRLATFDVICAQGELASGGRSPIDLEPFVALQRWLALGGERRVSVPFGWALARAMSTCSLELRMRRDFEALLASVRTIALLRQRHRKCVGGEIEAIIDDYRVARELLLGSFRAAEAESLPAAIRELASNVGRKEKITRSRLAERVKRPRSTLYYQVDKAIHVYHLLDEEKHGSRRLLTRNRDVPVPEKPPVLPSVEEVEGLFFGVPAPVADDWFYRFLDDFEDFGGVEGITAAEWAAWVGQPVDLVRERLDVLVDGQTLTYDPNTERYAFRRMESPIDPQPPPGETANPMPASKSEPSPNSQEEQAKSSPVQSSNEAGGDTSGPGGASVQHGQSREEPDLMAPSLEPRSPLPESDAAAAQAQLSDPSATKLPPPPRGS